MTITRKTKKNLKITGIIVAAILATVMLVSWIGNLSGGFENMNPGEWQLRDRNENNLIAADALVEEFDNGFGFSIKRNDDGTLTVNGKNESEEAQTVELGTIELEPGTYTFTTGKNGKNKDASNYNFHMTLVSGNATHTADFGETITVSTKTTFTVKLTLGAEKSFTYRTLYPTLVAGAKAEGFYQ